MFDKKGGRVLAYSNSPRSVLSAVRRRLRNPLHLRLLRPPDRSHSDTIENAIGCPVSPQISADYKLPEDSTSSDTLRDGESCAPWDSARRPPPAALTKRQLLIVRDGLPKTGRCKGIHWSQRGRHDVVSDAAVHEDKLRASTKLSHARHSLLTISVDKEDSAPSYDQVSDPPGNQRAPRRAHSKRNEEVDLQNHEEQRRESKFSTEGFDLIDAQNIARSSDTPSDTSRALSNALLTRNSSNFQMHPVISPKSSHLHCQKSGAKSGRPHVTSARRISTDKFLHRRLRDEITKLRRDRWKTACLKATSRDIQAPEGVHIQTILAGLREGGSVADRKSPLGAIAFNLQNAMESNCWTVVLKSQIVFHTIFRCGNQQFVDYMAQAWHESFHIEECHDRTHDGRLHMPFIRAYGSYLEAWLFMRLKTNFPPHRTSDGSGVKRFQNAPPRDLLKCLPIILDTFSALLKASSLSDVTDSPVARPAVICMLRDVKMFVQCLSFGLRRLQELFGTMASDEAVRAMVFYTDYRKCSARARIVLKNLQGQKHGVKMDVECCAVLSPFVNGLST